MLNSVRRAWRSVMRKPVKSLLLFLTAAVISLFLLSGMAAGQANVLCQDTARQAVGAGFRLDANEKNRSKRYAEISERIGADTEGSLEGVHQKKMETAYGTQWIGWADNSFETLKLPDIEALAAVEGISDYNITTCVTTVRPVGFERIEDPDVDQHQDLGCVTLLGNRKMEFDSNVLSGNVTLKEGRMAGPEDRDVCVISEELAAENGLALGDVLGFGDRHDESGSAVQRAEIIGIYRTKQPMAAYMSGDTFRSENVIFTDLRFPEKAEGAEGDPCFEHAYFQVADVDRYEEVRAAMEQVEIDWERYDFIDRNGDLSTMSSNFNDLEKISGLFVAVTLLAGFLILSLIFLFWIRNRSRECGILLSLGVGKGSILGQLFLEAFLISSLAFLLSLPAAPGVSKLAADYLVAGQQKQAELQKAADADKVADGGRTESEQTVTGVKIAITGEMAGTCGAGILLLTGGSVGIAGLFLLRKKPARILSELS
ncbi:MAG: ABC transporter permease [Lachnospiraceae bacterium]|nr:ABC transporter permease [Lachnospiraceae bacterium]